ncbi:hypothetical protein C9439_02125 [archaeon SCG-AAA382B04]|nr:hypothetical protein C9439_02125 [archaeon SCG-AAA382B04]
MDEEFQKYVINAIDCIDENSDEFKVSGKNNSIFRRLKDFLLDKSSFNLDKFRISDDIFKQKLNDILYEAKQDESPLNRFKEEINKLRKEIGQNGFSEFTILFPLNLEFSETLDPEDFSVMGHEIQFIPFQNRDKYFSDVQEYDDFCEFIEKCPNNIKFNSDNIWKFEFKAYNRGYALEKLEKLLKLLLGKINYSIYFNTLYPWKFDKNVHPKRWSDLRLPFIYFIFEEGNYSNFLYNEDVTLRKDVKISSIKEEKYKEHYPNLSSLSYDGDIEKKIISAFRAFQNGISEYRVEKAFLEFWRGLENLTFVDEGSFTSDVVNRAKSIIEHKDPFFEDSLDKLVDKRNDLVHEGLDVGISRRDLEMTKLLLEILIDFSIQFKDDLDKEEMSIFLKESLSKESNEVRSIEDLKHRLSSLEQKTKVVKRIIELREKE